MKKTKLEHREVEVIEDITCDCCGKSCKTPCDYEYATIDVTWGFSSNKDGEAHLAYLCESCYDKMLEVMRIKPQIKQY